MRKCGVSRLWTTFASLSLVVTGLALPPFALANNIEGAWSAVKPWPMIAIHAALLPDGRVLTFGNKSQDFYDVWDPAAGLDSGHLTLPNTIGVPLFCSSQILLPDGTGVFIVGGGTNDNPNNASSVFDYRINTIIRNGDLARPRYYGSTTTMLDGRAYLQEGSGGEDHPEIRGTDGISHLLTGIDTSKLQHWYPRNFVAPDGRIFGYDANGKMYYVTTDGVGTLTMSGQVTGPLGKDSSSAMFRPGKILQFGGDSNGARVIDITGGAPVVTATQALSSQRRRVNATILADGKVLATGGSEVANEMVGVNYSAEIWDPNTGQWTRGANEDRARLYHSTALLLPDASVLVAGGGHPGPQENDNVEIYYPPYLYDGSGGWAVRPEISSAPSYLDIGHTFVVGMANAQAVRRFVMVKTGSVSHGVNFDQRFVELTFQQNGSQLTVQAPTRAPDAPPGYYLLFAINQDGTPSIARIARVGFAGVPNELVPA